MKRRKGFSLLEIMMVLLILSVFSVVAIHGLHRGKDKAGAQGLALSLSEELKRVRQEAIARRRPSAFVLPTNGGQSPITRSYYVMNGEYKPRIVRSKNYRSEFNGANIFVGEWATNSGSWSTAQLKVPGSKWGGFDFSKWVDTNNSATNDNCFVFLPDGTVQTNGIHSLDGRYQILVSAGSIASGSRTNAQLQSAGESYTISISPAGGITLNAGILAGSPRLGSRGNYATEVEFSAPHPSQVTALNPDPLPKQPSLLPTPNEANIPAGDDKPDAMITKNQYVSLHMEAKSESGEQLFCSWKLQEPIPTDALGKRKESAFSIQGKASANNSAGGRMEWDQTLRNGAGAWKTDWQWRPPIDAKEGERYTLRCEVQNVNGGTPTVEIKKFEIKPPGRILFESDRTPAGIYTMDESGQRERLYLPGFFEPSATLAGERVACVDSSRNLILHTPLDPANNIILYKASDPGHAPVHLPAISPNGNTIAFYLATGSGYKLMVMKTGANATPIGVPEASDPAALTGPIEIVKLAWTKDGNTLLYPRTLTAPAPPIPTQHLGKIKVNIVGNGQISLGTPGVELYTTTGGQVSSATETNHGIIITDNYAPNYDPWITTGGSSEVYLSVGDEDASVERNPRGDQFMITHKPVASGTRQLYIVNWSGGVQTGVRALYPLTSNGNNFHPVWTK